MTEYPRVPREEIAETAEYDPARALLQIAANATAAEAERLAAADHEPKYHSSGWTITVETPEGILGLWSCWLDDQFFLRYPTAWTDVDDVRLLRALGAVPGVLNWKPYTNSDERAYSDSRDGRSYYVPRVSVPLAVDQHNSSAHHFHFLRGQELHKYGPPQVWGGWGVSQRLAPNDYRPPEEHGYVEPDTGKRVATWPFWRDAEDEGWKDRVQSLKPGFLQLLATLANRHGGATGITIEYGFVLVPEQLPKLGYETTWLRGTPGERKGWQSDAVYGKKQDEEVMLVSANSLVPWVCYRRVPFDGTLGRGYLDWLLTF